MTKKISKTQFHPPKSPTKILDSVQMMHTIGKSKERASVWSLGRAVGPPKKIGNGRRHFGKNDEKMKKKITDS